MTGDTFEAYIARKLAPIYGPRVWTTNSSGRISGDGDVKAGPWLIDGKGTRKSSLTIKTQDWQKLCHQAWSHRREPLLVHWAGDTAVATLSLDLLAEILEHTTHPILGPSSTDEEKTYAT